MRRRQRRRSTSPARLRTRRESSQPQPPFKIPALELSKPAKLTPSYVAEVFKSYISNKQKQGASPDEISTKLNYIQLKFPHFDHIAASVRENLGLPKKP